MLNDENKTGRARKEWATIALHVLIWLMVFLIPYIFSANAERGSRHKSSDENDFLYLNTALNFFWVALFYFNSGLLIQKFIYKRKIIPYLLILDGAFCLVILFDRLLFWLLNIPRVFNIHHSAEHNVIAFLFTVAVSAAYKAITDKTKSDIWIREKQSEHLKTELSFLRSQISPHFLFNVLNNIAALVRMKSNDLEPTVMKLSSLMQYMLYETDDEKVIVKSEAEYLQAYIDLQKQRYGDELKLQVEFDIKEEWHSIEPMLLIPFVENAFKHGGMAQIPEIFVSLSVKEGQLNFTVKNRFEDSNATKDKTSGIGLSNVKRRLELLYPGNYVLKMDKANGWFIIDLMITFKD
jgi:sensor histidine kinase YesM